MKKLYNNKNLYDWIVWICIIGMMINVFIPFKGAFYIFALMVLAIARYNNLSDKEIERLIKECEKMNNESLYYTCKSNQHGKVEKLFISDVDNFQGHNSVLCDNYEKDLDSSILKCKHCGMHEGFHWGKLTNNTRVD